jgi:hypothetical protein
MDGIRFRVEKAFTVPGRGVVVSGKIEEGRVAVGQGVGFSGADGQWILARVTAIEVGHRLVEEAQGEQKVSLLLEGIRKKQIVRGTLLQEPPSSAVPEAPPQGRQASEPGKAAPPSPHPHKVTQLDASPGGAIHPSSGLWRTLVLLLIAAFIILSLLFFQGRWDSMKKRTERFRFQVLFMEDKKNQDGIVDGPLQMKALPCILFRED